MDRSAGRERQEKVEKSSSAERDKQADRPESGLGQKFYGRYGHLQDADEAIFDPATKQTMDKIEFRLINFPFNDSKKKESPPPNPGGGGSWKKVREKLWTNTSTPNDPDQHHEQSGAPYDLTYEMDYYDRNGTQRWLKDTSKVSCKLDLLNTDRVIPGQKVNVSCSMSHNGERITNSGASVWAGDIPIQTPAGFRSDGSIYPFWGYRTDAVLRVSASNDAPGQSTGQFSFPAKPRTDNEPFCIRLTSGIAGVAAVEVCYEWQSGPATIENKPAATKWSGQWQSTWGNISIVQAGNNITGTYEHDNGRIVGSIVGNKIIGTWSEGPTYTSPNDAGDFEFTLSPDGSGFTGRWRYGKNGVWQQKPWTGTKAGVP